MSIEQSQSVDFVTLDEASGDTWLTISDHLPWSEEEGRHLNLLQEKINSYLRFIESGEMEKRFPQVKGRNIIIRVVGKFPLSEGGQTFFSKASKFVGKAGYELKLELKQPN